ncbi:outer membrane usher protein [Providencia rettgeri]|uniref:outer membrane usher protein n=1 Tax=Providencia rettgeri TaxID=587 RepID=UPI0034E0D4BD
MALLLKSKNKVSHNSVSYFLTPVATMVFLAIAHINLANADNDSIEFNTDILDLQDKGNISLSEFSRAGYVMPGVYPFKINLNSHELADIYDIEYMPIVDDESMTEPCLTSEIVDHLSLRSEWKKVVQFTHNGQCLNIESIPGMTVNGSLPKETITITIPQAYVEYTSDNWDPPSRWDEGVPALIFDYNLNANITRPTDSANTHSLTGNGTTGFNLGPWRFRADWQASYNRTNGQSTDKNWDWSQYYAYRAVKELNAKLTMGEQFLRSGLFDSFRYMGASLISDERMLPPNLRGYAPEVTGVAKTNAKVTVSQQGRVLYETQVAPGPFRIQDLSDAVSGKLDVRVEEQDGSVQEFQMNTASIPYLTRPGSVLFKIAGGRPNNMEHETEGQGFVMGEFTWGVSNGWSLFGGALGAGDYNALSLGIGRDLLAFGAISFDITESRAKLKTENKIYTGASYRLSYSKRFEEYDSQVTFAGYRFSERDFMSMNQYLDRRYRGVIFDNSKELYMITFNKYFTNADLTAYLNYSHETYWSRPASKRYNVSIAKYFDIGRFKNINLSLTAFRNKFDNSKNDDGMYMNLSMPWADAATVNYSNYVSKDGNSHTVSYYDRLDDKSSYRIGSGVSTRGRGTVDAYYNRDADLASLTASTSYINGDSVSAAFSMQGGATVTGHGAALHRITVPGGSRIMVSTEDAVNVPVQGFGATTRTNHFGKAVVADVSEYYRTSAKIDVNKLPENVEAVRTIQQATLTEGAVAYREFEVLAGLKTMVRLALADGSHPPFGATVKNEKNREMGIVTDNGSIYLSGVKVNEVLDVYWDGSLQCKIQIPENIETADFNSLLLPCTNAPTTVPGFVPAKSVPVGQPAKRVTPAPIQQGVAPSQRWLLKPPDLAQHVDFVE